MKSGHELDRHVNCILIADGIGDLAESASLPLGRSLLARELLSRWRPVLHLLWRAQHPQEWLELVREFSDVPVVAMCTSSRLRWSNRKSAPRGRPSWCFFSAEVLLLVGDRRCQVSTARRVRRPDQQPAVLRVRHLSDGNGDLPAASWWGLSSRTFACGRDLLPGTRSIRSAASRRG